MTPLKPGDVADQAIGNSADVGSDDGRGEGAVDGRDEGSVEGRDHGRGQGRDQGHVRDAVEGPGADAVGIEAVPELPPAAIDPQTLRAALGRFATGVTIVTCIDAEGGFVGLTVNSFASLSLHPPLVLWSLRESSPSVAAFVRAEHFVVNVLAEAQADVSRRFAARGVDKFDAGEWSTGAHRAPVLAGCAAVFQCETVSCQVAGDHRLFIGRVLAFDDAALPPLLYQGGHYRRLGAPL